MKAVIYLRVSTRKQKESKTGIKQQRSVCIAKAQQMGIKTKRVYQDAGVSGTIPCLQRDGFNRALNTLNAGDYFIVAQRCRLGRSVAIVREIEAILNERGAYLVVADQQTMEYTAQNLKKIRTLDVEAEVRQKKVSEMTKRTLLKKRSQKRVYGGIPYGLKRIPGTDILQECPYEQWVIWKAQVFKQNGLSLRAIVKALAHEEIVNRNGKMFGTKQIAVMLKKEAGALSVVPVESKKRNTNKYGFNANGSLHTEEQRVIALVKTLRFEGLPLRAIASELSFRGFRNRSGGIFVANQVVRMLR